MRRRDVGRAVVAIAASVLVSSPVTYAAVDRAPTGAAADDSLAAPAQRIAFRVGCDVWLSSPSGANRINITPGDTGTCDGRPSISRDGRYVAYSSSVQAAPYGTDIRVYDSQTGRTTKITQDGRSSLPDFSPVSNEIAFERRGGAGEALSNIFSMNVQGGDVTRWTHDSALANRYRYNNAPEWSPSGEQIYFTSSRDDYTCRRSRGDYDDIFLAYQLYRVGASGGLTQLTDDPRLEVEGVAVSGGSIAYTARRLPTSSGGYCTSEPVAQAALYVDGNQLTASGFSAPSWSNAGKVVFSTTGNQIALIAPTGGAVDTLFAGIEPDWGVVGDAAPTPEPSTISLNYSNTHGIRVNGQVVPAHAGDKVTITLEAQRGDDWRDVGTAQPVLSARSRYVVRFAEPKAWLCRLIARFPGDADHKPSTTSKTFTC